MAEIRVPRLEKGQSKLKNVPIAVTPEGFWCCPSPTVFQKSFKTTTPVNNKPKPHKKVSARHQTTTIQQPSNASDSIVLNAPFCKKKPTIEYGEMGTTDLKLILLGKQGVVLSLNLHRNVLQENTTFFADKLSEDRLVFPCLEIDNCDNVEVYAETIGLMYCKDMKQQLMKLSVSRVLRILKVGERLGFAKCVLSCLEYLEAVPWVGEEEEERVVSSVSCLGGVTGVEPVLKRVSSNAAKLPRDTLCHVLDSVLNSKNEKGRREMKFVVLKLLRENNASSTSSDLCNETINAASGTSLDSLLSLFRQAAESDFCDKDIWVREQVTKSIALEADNLVWMLDILANGQAADEFVERWAWHQELAKLHAGLTVVIRHHVSIISVRIFILIGRGEILTSKDTRNSLLMTWLQPLIDDYNWLQHGCRSFDRDIVEEGIGRTILTLPLEDQKTVLLTWLGCFLKTGDRCPNLQRAFEVWWRRTFVRPEF